MSILKSLRELGLTPENCVVIGSGVLSAYAIRSSGDIDVVTDEGTYDRLATSDRFTKTQNHGREVLSDSLFEIGTSWGVLGKNQTLDELKQQSVVIGGVRYIGLDFLLAVKRSWLHDEVVRQKDVDDVKLIEGYLARRGQTIN